MPNEIQIQGKPLRSSHSIKYTEQRFSEKVTSYAKDTSREIASPEELGKAVGQLKSQQLSLKDFSKLILQSSSSEDLSALQTFAEEVQLAALLEQPPKSSKTASPSPISTTPDAQKTVDLERNFMSHLSIIQTTADDQIVASQLIQKIFGGQTKKLTKLLSNNPALLEPLLDGLGKHTTMSVLQYRATLGFIQSVIAKGMVLPPELMAKMKKIYAKARKSLDDIEDLMGSADDARLSGQAKAFLREFYTLELSLENKEDLPSEVQDSYSSLMKTLEKMESPNGGI